MLFLNKYLAQYFSRVTGCFPINFIFQTMISVQRKWIVYHQLLLKKSASLNIWTPPPCFRVLRAADGATNFDLQPRRTPTMQMRRWIYDPEGLLLILGDVSAHLADRDKWLQYHSCRNLSKVYQIARPGSHPGQSDHDRHCAQNI